MRPASCCRGADRAPANWASSVSRDGRSASTPMSWADSTPVPTMPPFTTRFGLFLAKSRSVLATALTSPRTKAMAVGPVSMSWIGAWGPSATASRTKVFL